MCKGFLALTSCTRFSPTLVNPTWAAYSIALTGCVFVTGNNCTSETARPLSLQALSIRCLILVKLIINSSNVIILKVLLLF